MPELVVLIQVGHRLILFYIKMDHLLLIKFLLPHMPLNKPLLYRTKASEDRALNQRT